MYELFKTVLILSVFGFFMTALLLIFKPVTAKKFPAQWQCSAWITVMLMMVIPIYHLIPARNIQTIPLSIPVQTNELVKEEFEELYINEPYDENNLNSSEMSEEENKKVSYGIKIFDLCMYIWILGVIVFLVTVIFSYIKFIVHMKSSSVYLYGGTLLREIKNEFNIKRKIRLRVSAHVKSPMLVGILFPVIYVPCREIPDEYMRMIFRHELTHYKRKDLAVKWFSVFINAVHWFNPMAYLLRMNISEACEVACDMAVTKNMSGEEEKLYMRTILDLIEER